MKFKVQVKEVHIMTIGVEANSVDDAKEKVNDMIAEGDSSEETAYLYTMHPDEWVVEKI
jgi:hypothetical protein